MTALADWWDFVLSQPCPSCGAVPDADCTTRFGGPTRPHSSRTRALPQSVTDRLVADVKAGTSRPSRRREWSYSTSHKVVVRERGRAATHPCVRCEKMAEDWAYDHEDPDEKSDVIQSHGTWRRVPFSLDPTHYLPMCRSCHRSFDWRRNSRPAVV